MRWIYLRVTFILMYVLLFSHQVDGGGLDMLDGIQDLLRLVDKFGSDNGQLEYQGRTIHYKTKGRVHSFSEPWVYDGVAWDIDSGTNVKVHHFDESEDAARKAVEKLVLELKEKGIIKDKNSSGKAISEEL